MEPRESTHGKRALRRLWAWRPTRTPIQDEPTHDEASAGDPGLAAERLQLLDGIPLLPLDPQIGVIAKEIMSRAILPPKASIDALHIAAVARHGIQYLLTWNCKHIANAKLLPRIHRVLTDLGYPIPIICTPEEMVEYDAEE